MARAPFEEPEGLVYQPELLTVEEERKLLSVLRDLRFDPIVMHGVAARRVARHYGLGYDYATRTPRAGEPMPDWLVELRERVEAFHAGEYVEALVQRYPAGSTIGRHRDAPAFGDVVGVSLGGSARLRFERGTGEAGASGRCSQSRGRCTCCPGRRARRGSTRSRRRRRSAARSRSGR